MTATRSECVYALVLICFFSIYLLLSSVLIPPVAFFFVVIILLSFHPVVRVQFIAEERRISFH